MRSQKVRGRSRSAVASPTVAAKRPAGDQDGQSNQALASLLPAVTAGKESTLGLVAASPEAARVEGPYGAADPTYAPSPERSQPQPTGDMDGAALATSQEEQNLMFQMLSGITKAQHDEAKKLLENMKA